MMSGESVSSISEHAQHESQDSENMTGNDPPNIAPPNHKPSEDSTTIFPESLSDSFARSSISLPIAASKLDRKYSKVDPEMLRAASAAAIEDAIAMKQSDSILSTESNEGEDSSSRSDPIDQFIPQIPQMEASSEKHKRAVSNASKRYMEDASFELSMLDPVSDKVTTSGKLRRENTDSSVEILRRGSSRANSIIENSSQDSNISITEDDFIGPLQRRWSERIRFSSTSNVNGDSFPLLNTIVSLDQEDETDEEPEVDTASLVEVLKSCGLELPADPSSQSSTEARLLHAVFQGFCNVSLSVMCVERIIEKERSQKNTETVKLPVDVVVEKPSYTLIKLLSTSLMQVPREWALSLLRIFLRLLTNESDAEYDESVLKSCAWYDETVGAQQFGLKAMLSYQQTSYTKSLRNQTSFSEKSLGRSCDNQKANQLYTIVRLRRNWSSAVKQILASLEMLLNDDSGHVLQGPLTRLLGLLSTAGISVEELRKMLSLATDRNSSPLLQLLLVRALRVAADGSSQSPVMIGKSGPRAFFSFASGCGIERIISLEKSSWPFKNDFGMALQFRAECFEGSSTLLRVTNQSGDGTEVALVPLSNAVSGSATATVLVVSVLEGGKVVHNIKANKCILHERVWYHVAVRHTRSRLKGIFSLGSREQLSVMLDGKTMLTEALKFPNIKDSSCKTLTITFGADFDGQTGALHLFHDNVSDSTLKALYDATTGTTSAILRRASGRGEWDSRRGEIVRKSKILDLQMQRDDVEDIVLSQRIEGLHNNLTSVLAIDLDNEDESAETTLLSKNAFKSRLYVVWDPRRTEGSTALELHSGAHASLDPGNVQPWAVEGLQDVLGSIGGIQAVMPIFRGLLSGEAEMHWGVADQDDKTSRVLSRLLLCSSIPDSMLLLASLVRDHNENAREVLRCGAVDIFEQLLFANKKRGYGKKRSPTNSLVSSMSVFPSLSAFLVNSMLELRTASSHYVGLETKVFSQIIFNFPLWFGGPGQGVALFVCLLPFLSSAAKNSPEKVRDCVGVKNVIRVIIDLTQGQQIETSVAGTNVLFDRDVRNMQYLRTPLTIQEKRHAAEVMYGIIFHVLAVGSTSEETSLIVNTLSNYLELEWEEAAKEASENRMKTIRTELREEQYEFTLRMSVVLLFLLQLKPSPPGLLENLAKACGGVQGCAAWLLSSLVNSYCDRIRAIGVRCLVCYISVTSRNPDLPLSLATVQVPDLEKVKSLDSRSLQENTISLMSNVGSGFLKSNMGRNLAAISPAVVRSKLQAPSQLTARVVYKLLWHLLKSHRYRLKRWTQASLITMVFERQVHSPETSLSFLKDHFVTADTVFEKCVKVDMGWAFTVLEDLTVDFDVRVRDHLGMNTVMRLMRFMPDEFTDQWLSDLVRLSARKTVVIEALSCTPDWQPCLFQFISELVESLAGQAQKISSPQTSVSTADGSDTSKETSHQNPKLPEKHGITKNAAKSLLSSRLDISLELYASLLAYQFRRGGEQALAGLEDTASLQRVCLNGQEVFILLVGRLLANLSTFGVVSLEKLTSVVAQSDGDELSILLKRSAKVVTDTLLSSSIKGMSMPAAVDCWRCLRHLTAIIVSVTTRLGFGIADLLDPANQIGLVVDSISGGLYGIRLEDSGSGEILGSELAMFYEFEGLLSVTNDETKLDEALRDKEICRRLCVNNASQMLSLLDVFVFPESLDIGHSVSQLHGLALVRNTETRIGSAQGPLLASLVRLSLFLLSHLEPCSVKILQCSSRLRCLVHWIIELVRQSEALEGYSAAFNKLTAPFDRLTLSIVLVCQQTLKRCNALVAETESLPFESHFDSKEAQKKAYRRLLRVCLELREILVTIVDQRNEVLRACLSLEAFKALQDALGVQSVQSNDTRGVNPQSHSPKEALVRKLISSEWVIGFGDVRRNGHVLLPAMIEQADKGRGYVAMEDLFVESREIAGSFEKSLNSCFEMYLEAQRQWAETGAVRDLEFEGDTVLKKQSGHYAADMGEFAKMLATRNHGANVRWRIIDRKVSEIWSDLVHWKLSKYTDEGGRRIVLIHNGHFSDHKQASYELLMGIDREREEIARAERLRRKEELAAELLKRNADAFVPITANTPQGDVEEEEKDNESEDSEMETDQGPPEIESEPVYDDPEFNEMVVEEMDEKPTIHTDSKIDSDKDAWARSFIWSENESIVARFESIMIVTLHYAVEGNIILTTHGLYFHQTGDEVNIVTKETMGKPDPGRPGMGPERNRRWRLRRLKDVQGRRHMLKAQALELFFSDCHELFLNFLNGQKERNRFYAKLRNSCKIPILFSPKSLNPRTNFKKSNLTELWRKRRISNFDYLMALNRMAGRTFNDIAQYPVFPWVLSDYTSDKIDLVDSRVYRDLTKPVGALNPDRLSQLLERYSELEQFGFAENERFLYGSHYSSPGVILHFLIRQEPFTSMAIDLQSGRFDCPDRLFFDLAESWKGCNASSSDVKELIPEFFTLPEMFLNTNNFPLGKTQRGRSVDDVVLPPWARGSAHEFVRINRLALESEYVSRNLHHWIDLIFGYKQRGVEAEAAHNIFHHLSYEGAVDLDKITDELDRRAAESHIQHFGQTPSQLAVKEPHPPRMTAEDCWIPLINNLSSTVRLKCHTPVKQYGGKKGSCGSAIKISVHADTITTIYSDLKVGTFKWNPKAAKNRLKPDRLRSLPNRLSSNSRAVMKRGSAVPEAIEDSTNRLAVGNWSFAITLGGYEREQIRRKALVPSRLASAKDALYTDAASLIISCGYWDNSLKVHSTDVWKLEYNEKSGHRGPIRCLTVGCDGGLMITGGDDCTCRIWVVDHPDMAIALSDGYVQTAFGQSVDGDQVLSCCHVLWGHETPITCVDLSSELDVAVSGSIDGKICVHSIRRGAFIRSFHPPAKLNTKSTAISKLALDKHGRLVVHMSDNNLHMYTVNGVRLCSVDAGEKIHDMKITGEVLITGGDRCHVYIRDLVTLKVLSGLDLSRHGPIRCISLTPEELNPLQQHLFIGSDDGMISIVDRDEN